MHYTGPLKTMLERLEKTSNTKVTKHDKGGEWFHLSSDDAPGHQLVHRLKIGWASVGGAGLNQFAVIHCDKGSDRGLWLHHLGNEEKQADYLAGVHHIPSWDDE